METKELKQLIELLESSNLETLSYKNKNFEFEISKKTNQRTDKEITYQYIEKEEAIEQDYRQQGVVVKSPLVGIFYSRPSVDANPFVSIGSQIKVGDSICIVEAMKVMNEIKSGEDGKIVEIYVKDGDPVDYDQPLFRVI